LIKVVSFDVWNTLLKINVLIESIAHEISKLAGIDNDYVLATIHNIREELRKLRREKKIPVDQILEFSQEMLSESLNIDVEIVKKGIARAVLHVDKNELVFNDAKRVLEKLKSNNTLKIVVLGNVMFWPSSYTRLLLEKCGLAKYIDKQFYSDEIKTYKPFPEAFRKPLEYYGVEPSEAIHVGDSVIEDYKGALESGLYAVLVDRSSDKELQKDGDRGFIINSLLHLPKVLNNLSTIVK